MSELNKRLSTSLILGLIFFFSFVNDIILIFVLLIIFFQLYFEFYSIIVKIFSKKKKSIIFFVLILILIYLLTFVLCVAINFSDKQNNNFVVLTMIISICIGGYLFGKIFKGKKLTKISPKKTYSGLVGAYSLSIFFPTLIFNNFFSLYYIIMFSIIVSTVSQSGDLFISYLKRKAKIKDTGKFLPGHGGLLDRLDGIIFFIFLGLTINFYI